MTTVEEAYITHVGNVLSLIVQDKGRELVSLSLDSPNPLPFDFLDGSPPQSIQKVDATLQQVIQKMFRMEQELARLQKRSDPALCIDIGPPSPQISCKTEDEWELVNNKASQASAPSQAESSPSALAASTSDDNSSGLVQSIDLSALAAALATSDEVAPEIPSENIPCSECIQKCASVASSVVKGDLSVQVACQNTACRQSTLVVSINEMMAKLSRFTEEVTRVAALTMDGKHGVQGKVEGEQGVWKGFMRHLNAITEAHSRQMNDFAAVCASVAHGDLSRKVTVEVKGETLILKSLMNAMGKLQDN